MVTFNYSFNEPTCMGFYCTWIKPIGEKIVGAMLSDELICKKMRLGKYTTPLVNAVQHEDEAQ